MWLAECAAGSGGMGVRAGIGTVTFGGETPAVLLGGEARGLGLLAPRGVGWRPAEGTQVLVLETDDGERFVLGEVDGGGVFHSLGSGEVALRCGGNWLKVGKDGISAEGELHLDGDVYITGQLYVNGVAVGTEGA